ncbi:hypothetical protein I7I50_00534 [Histoplasma capsulatum G186AR]|uniref:Uncharacterized protein n=1 Tax=Ajellomyces capsulatus TaxID=5037 RepID=A0A8H7YE39_AJECA|nr:hypothetical protein I7I52_07802 [Histoplasma capsulatum]QSS72623.1 hypothetical protein I7I50_00534 [Histoplasma capsulatum G186AR]
MPFVWKFPKRSLDGPATGLDHYRQSYRSQLPRFIVNLSKGFDPPVSIPCNPLCSLRHVLLHKAESDESIKWNDVYWNDMGWNGSEIYGSGVPHVDGECDFGGRIPYHSIPSYFISYYKLLTAKIDQHT